MSDNILVTKSSKRMSTSLSERNGHCTSFGVNRMVVVLLVSVHLLSTAQSLSIQQQQQRPHYYKSIDRVGGVSSSKVVVGRAKVCKTTTALESSAILNPVVLKASLSATAKLLSSITIGALATPSGPSSFGRILDATAVTSLSRLTFWLFQPCFLLCGVAGTLAKSGRGGVGLPRSSLLLLPLASAVQIALGSIAAKLITTRRFGVRRRFLGIDDDDTANNVKMCTTFANSGPLPLIFADALFGRTSPAILTDVTACISFYLLAWSPLFWTFGRIILRNNDSNNSNEKAGLQTVLNNVLSPPVVGSILGVLIGSIPFLKDLFITSGGWLTPVYGAMQTLGSAYLPAAVLVLAGSLVRSQTESSSVRQTVTTTTVSGVPVKVIEKPTKRAASAMSTRTIVAIVCSRFLLSPLLALTTLRLLSIARLLPVDNARTLAIVTYTLLMEGCMPPAQNSVIILQLDGEKERAATMAKLLTVIYSLSVIPVTFLLSGCLSFSGIMNFQ